MCVFFVINWVSPQWVEVMPNHPNQDQFLLVRGWYSSFWQRVMNKNQFEKCFPDGKMKMACWQKSISTRSYGLIFIINSRHDVWRKGWRWTLWGEKEKGIKQEKRPWILVPPLTRVWFGKVHPLWYEEMPSIERSWCARHVSYFTCKVYDCSSK